MRIIDEWPQAWKYLSVNVPIVCVGIAAGYMELPDDYKAMIPLWLVHGSVIIALISGAAGRLIKQTPTQGNSP